MKLKITVITLLSIINIAYTGMLSAQEKESGGLPPAKVVAAEVKTGKIAPESEFIGTVFYSEVSDIASEVSGKVEYVRFDEGKRMKKGKTLVKLSADILEKTLESTKASYEQILSDLEKARLDLKRIEKLYQEESIAEQVYDENRFRVKSLEKKADSLSAEVGRLEIELEKKVILSPFDGVVIKRHVDVGEWLSPGGIVATIARDDEIEIVVNVPQGIIGYIAVGRSVQIKIGTEESKGRIFTVVPKGDVATRTFPVKIRLNNPGYFKEGMEARVKLPTAETVKTIVVPRDAVITVFGMTVVFTVNDTKAKMIPVKVVGYSGLSAGVQARGLEEGMKVVVKGNERLRDGQPVEIQ